LKLISDGGKFIIDLSSASNELKLSLSSSDVSENDSRLCDVSIRLFFTGDLKFYTQMLGRNIMSGSWCMWCLMAPNKGSKEIAEVPPNHAEEWTIDTLKSHKVLISEGTLKKPTEIHGVVEFPVWDFVEISHYIYPVLHGEIGLVNNALDAFYNVLDDIVEVMSDKEKVACNRTIISDAALQAAIEKLQEYRDRITVNVSFYDVLKSDISRQLQSHGISEEEKNRLCREREEINAAITNTKNQRKENETDVKLKRAAFQSAKIAFKEIRESKKKADRPVRSEIQSILEQFSISAAAYQGGDLNGVCARRLMAHSKAIFLILKITF